MPTFKVISGEMQEDDLSLQRLEYEYQLSEGELAQVANLPIAGKVEFDDGFLVERTS